MLEGTHLEIRGGLSVVEGHEVYPTHVYIPVPGMLVVGEADSIRFL